ncbi:hypothetical protein [Synoicihabitans lomoniglobus]|uniref:Uncharacterized protein n=1 Tax=Synoicihabitans lomoniglobus TaxID=2909285 RepID=A0AAE9ZVQ1_9BACT|nr:hypothetical protein [Opitutaceae bacterium LMO-M01]WED64271.1 hypothetical protein PXH66_18190 [Opitutaceae bacterium LMO-M01]
MNGGSRPGFRRLELSPNLLNLCRMIPRAFPLRESLVRVFPSALLVLATSLAGCQSTSGPSQPTLTVQADRAPEFAPPTDGSPLTFRLRFVNPDTQALIVPRQTGLIDALARLGFRPATREESPDTVVWIAAIENLRQEVKGGSMMGPPVTGNSDSIRHQNAAAMFGRYRTLLTDNRNHSGEMILGPEGEVIMTGNLASPIGEDSTEPPLVANRTVLRLRNVLAIWATTTAAPTNADDDGELWRVEIMSDLPGDAPPPSFDTLLGTAIEHLGQRTDGLREIPLPR